MEPDLQCDEVMNPRNATENPIDGNTPCGVRPWLQHARSHLMSMRKGATLQLYLERNGRIQTCVWYAS
eukprot:4453688-Amphidinium_carterae.2